jgi:hypothetical protein
MRMAHGSHGVSTGFKAVVLALLKVDVVLRALLNATLVVALSTPPGIAFLAPTPTPPPPPFALRVPMLPAPFAPPTATLQTEF